MPISAEKYYVAVFCKAYKDTAPFFGLRTKTFLTALFTSFLAVALAFKLYGLEKVIESIALGSAPLVVTFLLVFTWNLYMGPVRLLRESQEENEKLQAQLTRLQQANLQDLIIESKRLKVADSSPHGPGIREKGWFLFIENLQIFNRSQRPVTLGIELHLGLKGTVCSLTSLVKSFLPELRKLYPSLAEVNDQFLQCPMDVGAQKSTNGHVVFFISEAEVNKLGSKNINDVRTGDDCIKLTDYGSEQRWSVKIPGRYP